MSWPCVTSYFAVSGNLPATNTDKIPAMEESLGGFDFGRLATASLFPVGTFGTSFEVYH